jgi:hypothetical protein
MPGLIASIPYLKAALFLLPSILIVAIPIGIIIQWLDNAT